MSVLVSVVTLGILLYLLSSARVNVTYRNRVKA